METRIRNILINWAMLKDKVPLINSNQDPFYSQKLDLLLYGHESLNHSTYQEWSKDDTNWTDDLVA